MAPRLIAIAVACCHVGCDDSNQQAMPPHPPPPRPASSSTESNGSAIALSEQLRQARRSRGVVPRLPSEQERTKYRAWVVAMARAAWRHGQPPAAGAPVGFVAELGDARRVWLLREDAHQKRGAGFVALRSGGGENVIIEVPHTFFESGTLDLAVLAFEQLQAKALLVNTSHRGGTGRGKERKRLALSGKSPIDAAHNGYTFFATAHHALVSLDEDLLTVQLHGFADDRAADTDVVVSASRSNADVEPIADALGSLVGRERVRVYPDEIRVLGGTTNVEARACRDASAPFVHIEMSKTLRDRVRADAKFAHRFVEALGLGMRKRRPTPHGR